MGVTGLWKLIESSGKPVPLETLENKVLAIDISIWLHQVVKGYQDNKGGQLHNAHLLGLFNRICKLLYFRIKPVFVFDGAVPELKRQTIAKRAQQKTKIQSEAERLEQLLLQSLAKEKILKQVLGDPEKLILSPTKNSRPRATKSEERDDIYKLPDSVDNIKREVKEEDEEDEDELCPKRMYDVNIAQIDVNSPHFLSLPPDIRHEILNDIKETRKQNSWGRLCELPAEAPDFSTYQMSRLLRRRQVQIGLEDAEKEMGGKSWSLAELENLLSEDGVLEANSKHYQKIASNEHARFMLVKDIAQSMKVAKEEPEAKGPQPSTSSAPIECLDDEDLDLQRALQLSLGTDPGDLIGSDEKNPEQRAKLNQKQRQKFSGTIQAHGLIRGFMMEYAQMNDNDINDMMEVTQAEVDEEKSSVDVDSTLVETRATTSEEARKEAEKEDRSKALNSNDNTGSDSDEDFLEIESDSVCEKTRKDKIVISFDPNLSDYQESEDLFADLFEKPTEKVQEPPSEDELCDVEVGSISSDDDTLPYELQQEDLHDIEQITEAKEDEAENSIKLKSTEEKTSRATPVVTKSLIVTSVSTTTEEKVAETEVPGGDKVVEKDSENDFPELIEQDDIVKESPIIIESDEDTPEIAAHFNPSIESVKAPTVKDPLQILRDTNTVEELEQMRSDLKADQKNLSESRNKFDRMGANITDSMCRDCKELLKLFGIPYIDAPMEAEAQCAFLNAMKLTDGTISDDSDIWLFGGRTVYKNFFVQKKIVMEFNEGSIEDMFHLDRKKLIQLAMLVGSDYTVGINGIGAVTALEILAAFPPSSEEAGVDQYQALVSSLRKFREWFSNGKQVGPGGRTLLKSKLKNVELFEGFPNLSIARAYLEPIVDESLDKLSWGPPDTESLIEYAKTKLSWTRMKTEEILAPVMKRLNEKKQSTIKDYFKSQVTKKFFDSHKLSKRVQKAVGKMGGCDEEEPEKKEKPKKAPKRRAPAKKNKSKEAEKLSTDEAVVVLSDDDDEQAEVPEKKQSPDRPLEPQPSTSKSESSLFKAMTKKPTKRAASPAPKLSERPKRTVRIPETKQVIPQREKDKEEQEKAKLKAIEIFKKAKK